MSDDQECEHDCVACRAACKGLEPDQAFLAGFAMGNLAQASGRATPLCPAHAVALDASMRLAGVGEVRQHTESPRLAPGKLSVN